MPKTPRKLKVIPEAQTKGRTVMAVPNEPAFKGGQGPDDLVCGSCGTVLAEGVGGPFTLGNMVLRCYKCGSFNDVP